MPATGQTPPRSPWHWVKPSPPLPSTQGQMSGQSQPLPWGTVTYSAAREADVHRLSERWVALHVSVPPSAERRAWSRRREWSAGNGDSEWRQAPAQAQNHRPLSSLSPSRCEDRHVAGVGRQVLCVQARRLCSRGRMRTGFWSLSPVAGTQLLTPVGSPGRKCPACAGEMTRAGVPQTASGWGRQPGEPPCH